MNQESLKISRIADVIIDYHLKSASKDLNISIKEDDEKYTIQVFSEHIDCKENEIEELKTLLSIKRHEELEEYYWQLVANDDEVEELNLVGMMVDESEVEYEGHHLRVKLVRYKKK